ncbi:hypothetical protein C0Q70_17822 [Pomacea canaliculata]|uniref:RING-type domain-containing protein n=1 Tax=Pomacea canaliculata TaxID=400727 RepID=A0A2T7NLH8_POMCA|nr:hypothetical protein C0Q70_17822 [Pomacea canaliculata]
MAEPHERECAVCTNDFTTPKILPCGHLLCRECVISWMDSKADAGCPLCRCPIVEQSDGSSSATVDALPTDFVMEALVESARVLSKDHLCCVCEDVRADFICMQCQDMLCTACTKAHRKLSATRSHDVESVSTVTPERLAASRPALCADHGDKQAEFFCREHRLAVCSACKANKHKVCPKTNYLEDEIQSAQKSLNDLTKILVETEQKLEQVIGQVTSRLQEVDVSEQEDMAEVDKSCDRLHKLVEDFCSNLKEKTRTSHLKIRSSLRDVKTDLSNRLGKVTSHKHIVTRATAVSPRPALIHMTQALTDRVNSLDLSADLQRQLWVKPLSSTEGCTNVVMRIQQELLMLEQQWTQICDLRNSATIMAQSHERECAVCTNDFTTPKILPCGHLLCRQCVISWKDSKPDAGCPLCRCPIVEQSDGSSSDTVDALPTDFVMEELVESARVLSKDHLCCVCEDVRADFICMQCQVLMCSACLKVHKNFLQPAVTMWRVSAL